MKNRGGTNYSTRLQFTPKRLENDIESEIGFCCCETRKRDLAACTRDNETDYSEPSLQ